VSTIDIRGHLIIFGLSFVKQLAHGLVKRFASYVTLLNAFVLIWMSIKPSSRITILEQKSLMVTFIGNYPLVFQFRLFLFFILDKTVDKLSLIPVVKEDMIK